MTQPKRPPTPAGGRPTTSTASGRKSSTSPTGTARSGRRDHSRRRYEERSFIERFRTPILVIAAVAVIAGVSVFVFASAASPAYACTTIDTPHDPLPGELGQVQPDMGNRHVSPGDKVTYPVCPPASGKHINQPPLGPIPARFYGPDDAVIPNGWIHNLEHGGMVVLYSCDKGACDDATLQRLQGIVTNLPASPICQIPPGVLAPVVARFEQMPTKFAALVWDRVMYMDVLDEAKITDFYTRYSERLDSQGNWIAPPEQQCNPPSPSPGASESPAASDGASASPAASDAASPSAPAASPSAEPSPSAS